MRNDARVRRDLRDGTDTAPGRRAPALLSGRVMPRRRGRKDDRNYLTEDELNRFWKAIPRSAPRDQALFWLIYWYGLRASEPALLRHEDIDIAGRRIYVHRLKGSTSGPHDIDDTTAMMLAPWLKFCKSNGRDRPFALGRFQIWRLMERYGKKAGLPEYVRHPHVLKHTLGTHGADDPNVDVKELQYRLGHKRVDNTLVYIERSPVRRARMRAALNELSARVKPR